MEERLANEILDASNNTGAAVKRNDTVQCKDISIDYLCLATYSIIVLFVNIL